jgi:hypothetical protein
MLLFTSPLSPLMNFFPCRHLLSNPPPRLHELPQNANEVDAELEAIDRLASHVDGGGTGPSPSSSTASTQPSNGSKQGGSSALRLIQSYPDLVRAVERVASRSMPQVVVDDDETSNLADFPRETKKRTDALGREKKFEEALAVKDRMLWEVVQGHKRLEENLKDEKVTMRTTIRMKLIPCVCALLFIIDQRLWLL